MKNYEELTRIGRLRRLRKLAEFALKEYGLSGAKLTFLHYEGNVIFRVDKLGTSPVKNENGLFLDNRYVMRVLTTSDIKGIESELMFLEAMRKENLPVPEPVPTLNGKLLTTVKTPSVPSGKIISLMRWMDGRRLTKGLRPVHFKSLGQMMAQLHNFSASWQAPDGFERPNWDWEGQLGGRYFRTPVEELVTSIPTKYKEPFKIVSKQAQDAMHILRTGPDAFGMIHADMYLENVLFQGGDVFPIDFEDCGFGYWVWDIAIALCQWPWTEEWHWMRDALLEGYAKFRTLPNEQLKHLDLFMATQYATMVLWATMFIKRELTMKPEHEKWRNRDGEKLLRYFELGRGT
jgi:Ser/Thr protein kinase RdoA (MazF antagonist)